MSLTVEDLHVSYGAHHVLRGITLPEVPGGALTALLGPNAAGKTTLLKCIAGLLRYRGRVQIAGRQASTIGTGELTKLVSYLPQDVPVHTVLTAFEAVLLARQSGAAWRVAPEDLLIVERTLQELGIEHLAMRYLNELSGGQRQLISIAQALARRPQVLLLDEPTSNLDLHRQLEVLALVQRASVARGMTVIVSLHDLNLASRFASHFVVLCEGTVYAAGDRDRVLTPGMLRDVYGVEAQVWRGSDGIPQICAVSSLRDVVSVGASA